MRRLVPYPNQATPLLGRFGPLLVLALALIFPWTTNDYYIDVGIGILTFAILGLGLNIVVGYAGLLDLGYAAFFAIGAYTMALITTRTALNFWEALPVSILFAAVAGAILGYPTLRLRSDYLAIVTLGFGEIVRITATNLDFTGGPNGIYGIPPPQIGNVIFDSEWELYYLALALVLLTLFFTWHLAHSRLGRAWVSLREDESASEAVGVPSVRVKLLAYVFGAVWAGLAGGFFSARIGAISPDSFTYQQSVFVLMVVVLGGMASFRGVVLGAAVVVGLPELLRPLQDWRLFIFALGLIAIMLLRPQGIWPARRSRRDPFTGLPDEGATPIIPSDVARNGYTPSEPVLAVQDLVRHFGGVRAVNGVSFDVRRGEILSVIGPNGAGKTTVFNCITGVVRPTSGRVTLNRKSLLGLKPHQVVDAGVARTFQGIRLFRNMAVFENVMVGMYPRQHSTVFGALLHTPGQRAEENESLASARRWLRFVGLESSASRYASELAYGDQRRLEIARAVASGPEVLLLDEPSAGMNPSEKSDLMALIRHIRELGITVILIDHDMPFIMNLSDRIIVIDQGSKIAEGSPDVIRKDQRVIDAYLGVEEDSEQVVQENISGPSRGA